jgi:anti-sigma factor RsiW
MSPTPRFPHLPAESWALFLDERLPSESTRRLERHLDACPECRQVLEQADPSRVFRRLRGLAVRPEIWAGFWDDLAPQLGPRTAAAGPAASGRPSDAGARRAPLGFAAGVAAALIGVVALVATQRGAAPPPPARPSAGSCPPSAQALGLSRDECSALFSEMLDRLQPELVIVRADLDLRGL